MATKKKAKPAKKKAKKADPDHAAIDALRKELHELYTAEERTAASIKRMEAITLEITELQEKRPEIREERSE